MSELFVKGVLVQPSEKVPGVRWTIHDVHADERGSLTEAAVDSTLQLLTGQHIRQVNASISKPGVLRGMHWHRYQHDAWYIASGSAQVKVESVDEKTSDTRILFPGHGVIIPPPIAHGFLAMTDLVLIYAVTNEFDHANPDEQGYYPQGEWALEKEHWIQSERDALAGHFRSNEKGLPF